VVSTGLTNQTVVVRCEEPAFAAAPRSFTELYAVNRIELVQRAATPAAPRMHASIATMHDSTSAVRTASATAHAPAKRVPMVLRFGADAADSDACDDACVRSPVTPTVPRSVRGPHTPCTPVSFADGSFADAIAVARTGGGSGPKGGSAGGPDKAGHFEVVGSGSAELNGWYRPTILPTYSGAPP
jgi:hypothetical protein